MFHQVEGLLVDTNITFAHLKAVLMTFARKIFGEQVKVRYQSQFLPLYGTQRRKWIFPVFTAMVKAAGYVLTLAGWRSWGPGWFIPGCWSMAAMIRRKCPVLAFGMGIERIAMLKYGVNDLRLFFDNDLRFLKQF